MEVKMNYDVYVTRKDRLYIAAVPALPGCTALGRSEAEALGNIRDVIESCLRLLQRQRKPFPAVKVVKIHHARYPTVRSA
jgi:predicted RNase H-like HicB family nuclease